MLVLCAAIKVITGVQEHILASTSTDIFDTLQVTGYLNLPTALNMLRIGVLAFLLFYRRSHMPVSVTQGYRDQMNHHFQ